MGLPEEKERKDTLGVISGKRNRPQPWSTYEEQCDIMD